jgi:hypothetical protein
MPIETAQLVKSKNVKFEIKKMLLEEAGWPWMMSKQ